MRKAWIVARHEFLVTVKRWWFIVAAVVLPLVFAGLAGGMSLLAKETVEESERAHRGRDLGVVDGWGELTSAPPGFRIARYASEAEARRGLRELKIGAYVVILEDYVKTGDLKVVTTRRPTLLTASRPPLPGGFDRWLRENLLRDVDEGRKARALEPIPAELRTVFLDPAADQVSGEDAEAAVKRSVIAYVFFFLLFMSIFASSAYLLQGMGEEKENRVMEMVLSSVTPGQLMLGKLIGLGAAGLLQLLIWVTLGVVGLVTFAVGIVIEPGLMVFCLVYFLLGYALFGSLMLGFGALGTNFRESQQMASIWSFIGVSPMFIIFALIEAPQGTLARVFSFIPFTAPTTMMFRYTIDPKGTPVLDIVLSMVVLLGATALAVRISARLYRAGLLLYGKRPGLREIWRWVAAAR